MRHLYLAIWAGFVAITLSALLSAGLMFHFAGDRDSEETPLRTTLAGLAELIFRSLPPPEAPEFVSALRVRAEELAVELVVWDASHASFAATDAFARETEPLSEGAALRGDGPTFPEITHRGFLHLRGMPGVVVRLSNGYFLGVFVPHHQPFRERFLLVLALIGGVAALGCYPLARSITRRLEALERTVQEWGEGNLGLRAPVRGRDEVARLAERFNAAAEQVQSLVAMQRRVLASASHELRSPLARLRLALGLLPEVGQKRQEELLVQSEEDIAELDALVGDLLLAARADRNAPTDFEPTDVMEVLRREAARAQVPCEGPLVAVAPGNARLLARAVRNLLDNARVHGGGHAVSASLSVGTDAITLAVEDRGAGVPPELAQRIFEPFYRPAGHAETQDGGVGLGLALVRQVAEHHGGTAGYEPRPGGGSRFYLRLPLGVQSLC